MQTMSTDGTMHASQPLPTVINIPAGGKALCAFSNLSVTEYSTLATLGVPMRVIGINARLLRDLSGNDMTYLTKLDHDGRRRVDGRAPRRERHPFHRGPEVLPLLAQPRSPVERRRELRRHDDEVNICNSVDPTTKACG